MTAGPTVFKERWNEFRSAVQQFEIQSVPLERCPDVEKAAPDYGKAHYYRSLALARLGAEKLKLRRSFILLLN